MSSVYFSNVKVIHICQGSFVNHRLCRRLYNSCACIFRIRACARGKGPGDSAFPPPLCVGYALFT